MDSIENFKREFIKPFDLSEGPLFRFRIIKTQGNTSILCDFHHIILDGTSLNILFDEIAKSYDGIEYESEDINGFEYSLNEVKTQESSLYKESEMFFFNKIKAVLIKYFFHITTNELNFIQLFYYYFSIK